MFFLLKLVALFVKLNLRKIKTILDTGDEFKYVFGCFCLLLLCLLPFVNCSIDRAMLGIFLEIFLSVAYLAGLVDYVDWDTG